MHVVYNKNAQLINEPNIILFVDFNFCLFFVKN